MTTNLSRILGVIAQIEADIADFHAESEEAMERAAQIVEDRAKEDIGRYQAGIDPFADWVPLAPGTVQDKARLGYSPPDNPLLRTGDLRDSIEHTVESEERAVVGSDSDVAVWQELGTRTIPPRSFLGAAAVQEADRVAEALLEPLKSWVSGG